MMTTTTTTSTPSNSIAPSISSFDPQLLKLLARHHLQQQQQQPSNPKEFLQHTFYYNHPPPNTVATLSPRHHLTNGLSKLNTENSTSSNLKTSTNNNNNTKLDQQANCSSIKKQHLKEALAFDQWLQPPLGSVIQGPPCIQADTSSSSNTILSVSPRSKTETTLSSGERITCFTVGGEKRLCLPEILNTVLKDFSLQEINAACERLHIYCSRCTNDQLDVLKKSQVLPMNAPSCGLITQTDAERLCANLLQIHGKGPKRSANSVPSNQYERLYSIKVQHKCFGKCSGTLYPTLYIAPQAECILCDTCQAIFSPRTFVSHGHKSEENRICHWGFNSDNWRSYLKIRSTEDRKAHEELELFKEKFQTNSKKRSTQINNDGPSMTTEKRAKLSAPSSSNETYTYPYPAMKKDNHYADFAFNTCLPRPTPLPLALPVESMSSNSCTRPSPLRVVRSNSPAPQEPTTNFNDFSTDGIRQIVESTVVSPRVRQQLITYISQLQLHTYTRAVKSNSVESNELTLLKRENELLRERLSKYEGSQLSSNSSVISGHLVDCDDVESNVSSQSVSSVVAHETTAEQPKYFDRKRRLLAAEQELSPIENQMSMPKKSSPSKKTCLDQIVDSLNQKAQAEKSEDEEENEQTTNTELVKQEQTDDEQELNSKETSDDEDIDVDDVKFTVVESQ